MRSITALPSLKDTHVLVRVDYNVPIKNGRILDSRRIESSYRTLDALLKKKATPIILTHLGDGTESLRPVASFLSKKYPIVFITHDIFDDRFEEIIAAVPQGTLILLENIRRYPEEEANGKRLAKRLATFGKYYINDAFSVCHRLHASVVGIPKLLTGYAGFQLQEEVRQLSRVHQAPKHPFLFILGGAKFGTKIPLITRFLPLADHIVITGAILNTFYKVAGFEIGDSVAEEGYEKKIKPLLSNGKILLPIDIVIERQGKKVACTPPELLAGDCLVDIGPQSTELIIEKIKKARMIVWNGPTGWYEKGYVKATTKLARAIASTKAQAVIGGGDTGAVIEKTLKESQKNIFISTGGGATLEFLDRGTLPGIELL